MLPMLEIVSTEAFSDKARLIGPVSDLITFSKKQYAGGVYG